MGELLRRIPQLSPNLTVQSAQGAASAERIITLIAAGTPPDVGGTYVAQTSLLGAKNLAQPLPPLLASVKTWSVDDYFPGAREAFTFRGDLLLAPVMMSPRGMAVNLDLVSRAGLQPPPVTWTWDQLAEYATKLVERSGNEIKVYGVSTPVDEQFNTTDFFGSSIWSFGGDWADRAKEEITFHRPEGVAALETWVNLTYQLRVAPMAAPTEWQELRGDKEVVAFSAGYSAIAYCFSTNVRGYQQANLSFKWTTVHMPRKTKGGSHFFAFGWYIPQGAKQRDGAVDFIRLASLPEHIVPWNVASFGMVTRRAAEALPAWREHLRAQPLLTAFSEALAYARTYPAIAGWQDVLVGEGGVGQMVAKARRGEVAPRQALDEAARVGAAVLQRARTGA